MHLHKPEGNNDMLRYFSRFLLPLHYCHKQMFYAPKIVKYRTHKYRTLQTFFFVLKKIIIIYLYLIAVGNSLQNKPIASYNSLWPVRIDVNTICFQSLRHTPNVFSMMVPDPSKYLPRTTHAKEKPNLRTNPLNKLLILM
jgi:hypothetical protein